MQEDFRRISVIQVSPVELSVNNPTSYSLINKGAHGAVFRISQDKCVKIYADKSFAELEAKAYKLARHTDLVPKLYESGDRYNVIEFIEGPCLSDYLRQTGSISLDMTAKILRAIDIMKAVGFTRADSSFRHFLVDKNGDLKLIDLVNSTVRQAPEPTKIFTWLKILNLYDSFMENVKTLDRNRYERWKQL